MEEKFIRQLVRSQNWSVIESFAEKVKAKIREENTVKGNQWETLKATLEKEGKLEGINLLLSEMFLIGSNDEDFKR